MVKRSKVAFQYAEPKYFTDEIKLQWLRLLRSENIGPVTFYHLLNRFGSAEEALRRLPDIAHRAGRTAPLLIPSMKEVTQEFLSYQEFGAHLIARPESTYPELLRSVPDAPPLISVYGRLDLLTKPSFSIVGARNASTVGRQLAEEFSQALSTAGFVITSGLARGIDTHAHKGGLKGGTIAVLAGGVDHIYPPENKPLYKMIATDGLLLSETPLGVIPQASFFPRRNRIISGLSWGLLVVEAALKSGSLLTAKCATEQGRDVFAVPGNPLDPRSRGTNNLIKQGAILAQNVEDILQEYKSYRVQTLQEEEEAYTPSVHPEKVSESEVDAVRETLWRSLNTTPLTVDELVQFCDTSVPVVRAALVEIEIAGYLDRHPGDRVSLLPSSRIKMAG